ncbi:DsbA family protein [Nocardioides gansuensis]|nr:thioredoxin domain-containing protein [Nocardioides gansuensis]
MSKKARTAAQSRADRAAAAVVEQEAAERRRRLLTIGGVLVVIVAVVAGGFWLQSSRDTTGQPATPPGESSEHGLVLGDASAPHTVVIYEDFLCPFCGDLERAADEGLTAAVEEGRARVEYRPVVFLERFGSYSLEAANAFGAVLDTSGPEVAKEFHDRLFEEQPAESGPFPETSWFTELAVEAGADEAEVAPLIEDGAFVQWAENATEAASQSGVVGTPTVLLDDEPVEGATIDEMVDNLMAGLE